MLRASSHTAFLSRRMAIANLILAPFLLVFLLIYFFLRNAERFYHSPNSLGARRWSPLAAWRLREFNELPYYVQHRQVSLNQTLSTIVNNLVERPRTHSDIPQVESPVLTHSF